MNREMCSLDLSWSLVLLLPLMRRPHPGWALGSEWNACNRNDTQPRAEYPLPLLQGTCELGNKNARIISDFAIKPQKIYKTLSQQYLTTTVPINLLLLMRIIIVQGDILFS